MSMILSPEKLRITDNESITEEIGNEVRDAIKDLTGVLSEKKGINDLYIGEKKICGILTEVSVEGESGLIDTCIIGIGVNVNAPFVHYDARGGGEQGGKTFQKL